MAQKEITTKIFDNYLYYRSQQKCESVVPKNDYEKFEKFYLVELKCFEEFERKLKQNKLRYLSGAIGLATLHANKVSYEQEDLQIIRNIIESRDEVGIIKHFKKLESKNNTIEEQKKTAANILFYNIIESLQSQASETAEALKLIAFFIKQDVNNVQILEEVATRVETLVSHSSHRGGKT